MYHFQQLEKVIGKKFKVELKNEIIYETDSFRSDLEHKYLISNYSFYFETEVDNNLQQLIEIVLNYNMNSVPLWQRIIRNQPFEISEIPKAYLSANHISIWMIKGLNISKELNIISAIFDETVLMEYSRNIILAFVLDSEEVTPEILLDHFETELMRKVKIIVGPKVESVQNLSDTYETVQILDQQLNTDHSITKFENILLEYLIVNLDMNRLKMIHNSYKDIYPIHLLTPELNDTINSFFEHNLNVTDTANVLFLHRNTLIYRLNKINQLTNLDIRKFEDANKMKILLTIN